MTLRELQTEVSALGFDSTVECDALFITAANRALSLIYDECCITSDVRILAMRPPVLKHIDAFVHVGGSVDALPVSGRAYSMYVSGKGMITVSAGNKTHSYSFDGDKVRIRGFLDGDGSITFSGNNGYTVTLLTIYKEIFGAEESDIPDWSDLHFYDLRKEVNNFVSFTSPARDCEGKILKNATLSDGKLIIHGDYSGIVHLTYRRSPKKISSVPDSEIDLPREAEAYLPILTAAFLWLDDDEEKARYYMDLYRNFCERRKAVNVGTVGGSAEYTDVNRWA